MSGGFPVVPSRAAFGPKPENRYEAGDPAKDMSAELADLILWQTAGAGLVARKAWVLFSTAGAVVAAAEAWDPDSAFAPSIERSSAGVYVVTYPALVPDKDAEDQSLVLNAAKASPQSLSRFSARALVRSNQREIDVLTFSVDAGGTETAADCLTLLELS